MARKRNILGECKMVAGLILLCCAYVLSQFFRAFLAVLSTVLQQDVGAGPDDLAVASGLWFLTFAAMQIPIGWALDKFGPRRTASSLLLIGGGGGALLFAMATTPLHINVAMGLIGIGCAPLLMASYYIFARQFPARQFATLGAVMIGVGSVGNLVASYPMAWAAETIGWRASLMGLAGIASVIAIGVFFLVKDPPALEQDVKGSLRDLFRIPALWPIFPLMFFNFAPSGAVRGLWIGPYLSDVYGMDTGQVGQATLVMGCAMIAGTLLYGPLDRIFGTQKGVILLGNLGCGLVCLGLAFFAGSGVALAIVLLALLGLLGASFPVMIAHARAFFPTHLMGRGVTLMNLFGIGGAAVMQFASGRLHTQFQGDIPETGYAAIFAFFGLSVLLGVLIYLFSRDAKD